MSKHHLYPSIGKPRSTALLFTPRYACSHFHTTQYSLQDESKGEVRTGFPIHDTEDVQQDTPKPHQSRQKRLHALTKETQGLYERSSQPKQPSPTKGLKPSTGSGASPDQPASAIRNRDSQGNSPSYSIRKTMGSAPVTPGTSDQRSESPLIRRFARNPASERSSNRSPSGTTAPSSLKERLRERAAERSRRDLRPSPTAQGPRTAGSFSSRRPPSAQPGPPQARTGPGRRRDRGGAGVTDDRGDQPRLVEETEESDEQAFQKHLEKVQNAPLHQPTIEKLLEMPAAVNGEPVSSGIQPQQSLDRLMAIAKEQAKGEWAHVDRHEQSDADLLTKMLKLQETGDDVADRELQDAQKGYDMVVGKWVEGQYSMPERINDEFVGNALKGLMANESYTTRDQQGFMAQFEKILGQTYHQPKGKVAKAVEAAARENAVKGNRKTKTA